MKETDRERLKRKKRLRAQIAETRERKKKEEEILNGGERKLSFSYWIISDCQWLRKRLFACRYRDSSQSSFRLRWPKLHYYPHQFNLSLSLPNTFVCNLQDWTLCKILWGMDICVHLTALVIFQITLTLSFFPPEHWHGAQIFFRLY